MRQLVRESNSIIDDGKGKFGAIYRESNDDSPCSGVFGGVGGRLLSDSIKLGCNSGIADWD